jgi:hypothetical protein
LSTPVAAGFRLNVKPGLFAVARLSAGAKIPAWALRDGFHSITRTATQLSIVCRQDRVPAGVRRQDGFRCLEVLGPLAFDAIGVLSSLVWPLASARISILAISTFDTDLLFVPRARFAAAVRALERAGHRVAEVVE